MPKTRQGMSLLHLLTFCFSDPRSMARHVDRAAERAQAVFSSLAALQIAHFFFLLQISRFRSVTGIWPRGSKFKAQCYDQVVCPSCVCTTRSSTYLARAAVVHTKGKRKARVLRGWCIFEGQVGNALVASTESHLDSSVLILYYCGEKALWQTTSWSNLHILTWHVTSKFTGGVLNNVFDVKTS